MAGADIAHHGDTERILVEETLVRIWGTLILVRIRKLVVDFDGVVLHHNLGRVVDVSRSCECLPHTMNVVSLALECLAPKQTCSLQ